MNVNLNVEQLSKVIVWWTRCWWKKIRLEWAPSSLHWTPILSPLQLGNLAFTNFSKSQKFFHSLPPSDTSQIFVFCWMPDFFASLPRFAKSLPTIEVVFKQFLGFAPTIILLLSQTFFVQTIISQWSCCYIIVKLFALLGVDLHLHKCDSINLESSHICVCSARNPFDAQVWTWAAILGWWGTWITWDSLT